MSFPLLSLAISRLFHKNKNKLCLERATIKRGTSLWKKNGENWTVNFLSDSRGSTHPRLYSRLVPMLSQQLCLDCFNLLFNCFSGFTRGGFSFVSVSSNEIGPWRTQSLLRWTPCFWASSAFSEKMKWTVFCCFFSFKFFIGQQIHLVHNKHDKYSHIMLKGSKFNKSFHLCFLLTVNSVFLHVGWRCHLHLYRTGRLHLSC